MEKLTLRQFADVIKALVEADMPKEAGFTLKVVESGDKEKADGQKVELVCTKEEKKEDCECQDKDKDDFTDDFDDDDLDDDWDDDENTCECCKKALKAALIGAAVVPLSIMIFKRIRK